MKKIKCIAFICLVLVAALYLSESLYISIKVRSLIVDSYNNYGENNPRLDIVSNEIYSKMCYRCGYSISLKNNPDFSENNRLSFPFAIHRFSSGKVFYRYSYELKDENGTVQGGSWRVPVRVDVKFSGKKLIITDYYEAL